MYIEPTTLIMLKEVVYVHTLGNRYLLDALVMHIYKNVLYWKFLLITKRVMFFHCVDPPVKRLMNLTPLLRILRKLQLIFTAKKQILY